MPPTPPVVTAAVVASPPSSARLLVCCKVYVSEGRNQVVLDRLAEVARTASPGLCALVQRFSDAVYHRSNFTLGGAPAPVLEVALQVIDEALGSLDMTTHGDATHPRVGAVDHVAFHPLGSTPLETARDAAMQLGQRVGEKWPVPILMYGACNNKSLAEVRRSTSYFKGLALDSEIPHADFGPTRVDPKLGLLCCGAVPYVQNYNIRLNTSEKAVAARVTRAVRSKDGGPEGVEALTLRHDGGHMEVACNLLALSKTGPEKVLEVVREAAREEGVEVEEAYTIGMTGQEIWNETKRLLREGGEGGRDRM